MGSSDLMSFVVCGERYGLSEYDNAIKSHKSSLGESYSILTEFPYTIRNLRGDSIEIIKDSPVFILYKDRSISFYEFLIDCRDFESRLPLSQETNSLEQKYDLELAFRPFKQKNDYHSVIYETFRVFQDFHFMVATARWALVQAHRILHFRSGLLWDNGWEQLWTRATWLNNAIILYDSCFDKLVQAVWIGTEGYTVKKNINRKNLYNTDSLDDLFRKCWRRDDLKSKKISSPLITILMDFLNAQPTSLISKYAQNIKHRGGMRYEDLFPFGQIGSVVVNGYNPSKTRNIVDMDDVIEVAMEYHVGICKVASDIVPLLIEEFKEHGYLTGEDIVF